MLTAKMQLAWSGLYFGGVAFKYKRQVDHDELGAAAARAAHYMDVVCTSGPETGKPASIEKIQAMHAGLGDGATSLAVASGITVDNVKAYLPYVDAYLVGTGIEKEFGVFDHVRVQALARKIEAAGARVIMKLIQIWTSAITAKCLCVYGIDPAYRSEC